MNHEPKLVEEVFTDANLRRTYGARVTVDEESEGGSERREEGEPHAAEASGVLETGLRGA